MRGGWERQGERITMLPAQRALTAAAVSGGTACTSSSCNRQQLFHDANL